ncbi:PepSY-associated TM helix domain-containing protein [Paraglaciecola sp. 2405UD69-4]|uniref:PepSY-associated TM helix domain-containing protein n=1 Tax=Paraglaciecola sp. 2405UD69-4 TaxID=3391836 RepID=UPI0039C8F1CC
MKGGFRRNMVWLHTYSGLVLGWLLFTIFLTGTLSYFNPEITQWMKPELTRVTDTPNIVNRSLDELHARGQDASNWLIYLPSERTQDWYIQWGEGRRNRTRLNLSVDTLKPDVTTIITPRETASGNFFRVFHYTLELREYGGRFYAGIAAMFMLVAVFTGIFTHRRFFRDFFTLRLSKLSKTLTDFHALAGLVSIPFCIMICTSGIMVYVIMYMPFSADHYVGGERAVSRIISPGLESVDDKAPKTIPLKDFTPVQKQIQSYWPEANPIKRITFQQPYSEAGRIIVERIKDQTISRQSERLVFSSHSGKLLESYPQASTAANVRQVFWGLHEAHFADLGLRWLLFWLGLISTALIATGSIIWLNKRLERVKTKHLGHKIVERLNVAVIAGLPLAIAAFFISNRLLPVGLENRADAEVQVFLWVWLACLIHSVLRPTSKAWVEQLLLTAIGCFMVPVIDLYQDSNRLINGVVQFNTSYVGFALVLLVVGAVLAKTALWLRARSVTPLSSNKAVKYHAN